MKISPTTFEQDLRGRLLDLVYGQWHDLGVPFSVTVRPDAVEVIDPEALLWCSFEFLPTEPRLQEGVTAWLDVRGDCIIRQRIKRLATRGDPRTGIWHAADKTRKSRLDAGHKLEAPAEPCHGLDSSAEVSAGWNIRHPAGWRRAHRQSCSERETSSGPTCGTRCWCTCLRVRMAASSRRSSDGRATPIAASRKQPRDGKRPGPPSRKRSVPA